MKENTRYSLVIVDGYYRIQCDKTKALVSGKMSDKNRAKRILKEHIRTYVFKEAMVGITKEDLLKRVKIFGGRLRPVKKPWTIEEARLVASIYGSRGELFNKNKKLYHSAYQKGWLNEICAHMAPSRKKNQFVMGVLNPNKALAKIFEYETHFDFSRANQSAYCVLRRYGVDTVELFENRDNASYLKSVICQLADDAVIKML